MIVHGSWFMVHGSWFMVRGLVFEIQSWGVGCGSCGTVGDHSRPDNGIILNMVVAFVLMLVTYPPGYLGKVRAHRG